MTQPPEYVPDRTETQRLADDITTAMHNLRNDWPHTLRPGDTQAPGWANRTGITLDDHDRSDADTRRIDRIISWRRYAMDVLGATSRLIIEDRPVTNGATTPLATNPPAMADFIARHADWLSGQDAAPDIRDELKDLAHRCHLIAYPTQRESMSLGRCPLEIPGEQDVLETCSGDVRYRLTPGERDGEAMAACNRCGEAAVFAWWEERMFDDPETRRWLTDADVVTFMHRTYGEVIAQATVRKWVERGILVPSGDTNDGGRRLFARDAVVYAIDLHKRRVDIRT